MKNHFISGLSNYNPSFSLTEWYQIMPQWDITLNHLRSLQHQPKISAQACLFRNFNFNRMPLTVPGTNFLPQKALQQRHIFALNSIEGFYVRPTQEKYICYKNISPIYKLNSRRIDRQLVPACCTFTTSHLRHIFETNSWIYFSPPTK